MIFFLLPIVILGGLVFLATSTPKDYKCPDGHDAEIAFNGYGKCMDCGWLEDMEDL